MDTLGDRQWEAIAVGDELPSLRKEITQENINRYAAASEDPNPLHTDPEFAKTTPFKGTIAHGTLYLAYISEMMMRWFPHRWMAGGEMEVAFLAPARPGDTLFIKGRVSEKRKDGRTKTIVISVSCEEADGRKIAVGSTKLSWY